MGAGQPETAQDSAKLEDLTEHSDYAPLLPSPRVRKDAPTTTASANQPPVAVSVQRDGDMLQADAAKANGYRTDLCDCCAEPGGAAPSIIPCWAAGLTFGVLQFLPMLSHKTAGIYMPWVLQMLYRRRIRQHFKIEGHSKSCSCGNGCPGCCCKCSGDDCADCCSSFWCLPCSLCQDAREIVIRGHGGAPTVPTSAMTAPSSQDMTHV